MADIAVRPAQADDYEAVAAFTADTWQRLDGDYIPDVFDEWVASDGPTQRTLVATVEDRPVGLCQGVLLSEDEAWAQGMRVDPEYRGRDIARRLVTGVFEWAADAGATVCRNMVFSWNEAGLGLSRSVGFEPLASFRWLEPTPDADADCGLAIDTTPDAAWRGYRRSDACRRLHGLGLDTDESWALAELTRERLAAVERPLVVADDDHIRGVSYRVRTTDEETDDGESVSRAEYGVGAWNDAEALSALSAAVARDAAAAGADRTRLLVPETPRHISDAAAVGVAAADAPDFVLERELTRY